jgi:hypothetical protein
VSERPSLRRRLAAALLQGHFLVAASSVPAWRVDVRTPPAAVLMVGEPTPPLR